jgi:hypothetical protein
LRAFGRLVDRPCGHCARGWAWRERDGVWVPCLECWAAPGPRP